MTQYQDLTISISPSVIPWRAKWAATFVASTDMATDDTALLERITGYGATPLEAAADLLNQAVANEQKRLAPEDDPRYSVIADLVERHESEGR